MKTQHSMGHSMLVNFRGTCLSRIFGLIRDMMMTWYWGGSGIAQSAFHTAFAIPNMFRSLFGEGAFTAAFVPVVSGKIEQGDKEGAWRVAERTISLQMIVLAAVVIGVSLISLVIRICLPEDMVAHVPLIFEILPILMPYALLICVAGSFGSILNSLRCFGWPSLNPVLFNLVQIGTLIVLKCCWSNDEPRALMWFCLSVLLAGIVQVVSLMLVCRKKGFHFHFHPLWNDPEVKGICKRFLPGTVGAGASQINQLIDKVIVNWLGTTAVSGIAYSNHLIYLPVGLFGVAMGTVCLTEMSRAAAKNDSVELSGKMDYALRMVLFMSLPCAALLFVLALPCIELLFKQGAYNDESVKACLWALLFYVPGLPAFCCLKVATNPHHAYKDTRTPVKVALVCILLNLVLNLSLMGPLKQGGLALATSICAWINMMTLLILARKYVPTWDYMHTIKAAIFLLAAACISAVVAFILLDKLPLEFENYKLQALVQILVGGISGLLVYGGTLFVMRRQEPRELLRALFRRG